MKAMLLVVVFVAAAACKPDPAVLLMPPLALTDYQRWCKGECQLMFDGGSTACDRDLCNFEVKP